MCLSEGVCLVRACALWVLEGITKDEIEEKAGAKLLLLQGNRILAKPSWFTQQEPSCNGLCSHEDKANMAA